jgi:hypothetical protein
MAATISTFAQAGAAFNGAIHRGSAGAVVGGQQTVQAAPQARKGQIKSAGPARIPHIVAGLDPELVAANTAGNGGRVYGGVAATEPALRSSHPGVVDAVFAELTLVALAMADGATGLQVVTNGFAAEVTAGNATHVNLTQIGAICDGAAHPMLVGISTNNVGTIEADSNAVRTDLNERTAAHPGSERRGSLAHRVVR